MSKTGVNFTCNRWVRVEWQWQFIDGCRLVPNFVRTMNFVYVIASVDWSFYWFEVWGLNAKRRERFVNGAHDMQQRSCRFSRDLEHAHQAVSGRLRDNDKAGVVGQARCDWFAHC